MGIIRLLQFIKAKAQSSVTPTLTHMLRGATFAIDASSTVYKVIRLSEIKNNQISVPMDAAGNKTGHLIGLLSRLAYFKELGIKTIWVFDGAPPQEKMAEITRRREKKDMAFHKYKEAMQVGDFMEAIKQSQQSVRISRQQIEDAMELVRLSGMAAIQAKGEADLVCSSLCSEGICQGVIGQDSDMLVRGVPTIIRNLSIKQNSQRIQLKTVLRLLQLTQAQFVDMSILAGCDYTARIDRLGVANAYRLIKKYGNIENYMVNRDKEKYIIPNEFNYLAARQQFLKVEQIPPLQTAGLQLTQLQNFLIQKKKFSENRVLNFIKKMS